MKRFLISFFLLFSLAGCGGTYQQSVQVADNGYLLLTGEDFQGKTLIIDDDNANPSDLWTDEIHTFNLHGEKAIKIRIPAGKHNIKIIEAGKITVNRDFYISTGTSFEVEL